MLWGETSPINVRFPRLAGETCQPLPPRVRREPREERQHPVGAGDDDVGEVLVYAVTAPASVASA